MPRVTPEGAAHDARSASQYPAEPVTAGRGFPGPGTLARGLSTRSGDTMKALAVNDIEAADVPARHGHTLAARSLARRAFAPGVAGTLPVAQGWMG